MATMTVHDRHEAILSLIDSTLAEFDGGSGSYPLQPDVLDEIGTKLVTFTCHECDEVLTGLTGQIGKCSFCDTWLDCPED